MPNHVTTEVTAPTKVLRSLYHVWTEDEKVVENRHYDEFVEAEKKKNDGVLPDYFDAFYPRPTFETRIDFGVVIPEPENIERGGCSGNHAPGEVCWYRWNTQNWGTKWNAYDGTDYADLDDDDNAVGTIRFDTAWSHPFPVIEALSMNFPDEVLHVKYADEDLGYNLGEYDIRFGVTLDERDFADQDDAFDFAARLKYNKSGQELRDEWAADEAAWEAERDMEKLENFANGDEMNATETE